MDAFGLQSESPSQHHFDLKIKVLSNKGFALHCKI